ncbi:pumilio-family RNA-binding repeatprotein [Medicago truncatula]|uniref:Pumilio-family RNA-binding repeatprotein n=1 Tax=Medicago truncatula TaxID=3880 RepID=G7JJK9_MEDTR|nr:pumilio-family RNA-binding repeatprotein [Medicago truncatula]
MRLPHIQLQFIPTFDKNTDGFVSNNDTPKEDAPELQLQHEIVPLSVALQLNEEEGSDGESDGVEIHADSPVSKSHPFATVIPHRCPIITKDLETIQKALVGSNVADEDGFTAVVSKSSRKKKKGYQTRSQGFGSYIHMEKVEIVLKLEFIYDAATRFCFGVATDQHGCYLLQRCIEFSNGNSQQNAIAELTAQFKGNYVLLSVQKFSIHVVEKCLEHIVLVRADKLASHGYMATDTIWWDIMPEFVRGDFFRDRIGLPNLRFP